MYDDFALAEDASVDLDSGDQGVPGGTVIDPGNRDSLEKESFLEQIIRNLE